MLRRGLLAGGFLVALSSFQAEFDFGVPQFRQVLHPVLIMLAGGVGLVTARVYLGRGGALQALLGFLLIRGLLAVLVGEVWDQTTPHFPLYLVEALLVEAVFLSSRPRSPVALGALAGLFIGTVGLAVEWGSSNVWMPHPVGRVAPGPRPPWPAFSPRSEQARLAASWARPLTGRTAGTTRLEQPSAPWPGLRALRGRDRMGAADLLRGPDASARVTLGPDGGAIVRIEPSGERRGRPLPQPDLLAGRGQRHSRARACGPGRVPDDRAGPGGGAWKTLVRAHVGSSLAGVPVHLPEDRAIPAPAVPAPREFTRAFVPDRRSSSASARAGWRAGSARSPT